MTESHSPTPSNLAEFIEQELDAIVNLFAERVRPLAPRPLTMSELRDHVPPFLREVVQTLRAPRTTEDALPAKSPSASAHGRQRLRLGYDIGTVVREYGILRDTIYLRLRDTNFAPSLFELRIVSDSLSGAVADSVTEYSNLQEVTAITDRQRLIALFAQSPGFLCFLRGPDQIFELANPAYFQLVGHRDLLGKKLREALPELAGQGFFELVESVYTSGVPFVGRGMKVFLQREPGAPLTEAFVDLVYQPIRGAEGTVEGILAQGHDVTESKQVEARRQAIESALRASELRYRSLFESIDDGFCVVEMIENEKGEWYDYHFLETNAAFEGHTGLKNALGKNVSELVPDLDQSWFDLYGSVARTGATKRFENHAPAMNRWFEVYASRTGDRALKHVAIVFKDITERKVATLERDALHAREVAARLEAETAGRLRDEFLATVSHELRTPLNSMLGWVQMLRGGKLSAEKHDRALETIERNARSQAQLIDDLLDVSRILAGKLRLDVEVVDLDAVVEAALDTVRPAALAKGIRLQSTLASSGTVMGDPHRLQQVVWNLLSNAVKFTPKDGRVQVLVCRHASAVEIVVTDTGQGIRPEFQAHAFERFRQADGATTRTHGGLGLGLSIVRQLVEMHGGTVAVFSEGEGLGSTFTVTLPISVAKHREGPSRPSLRESTLTAGFECPPAIVGLDILIVDDENDTRDMLRTLLESCGARVRDASSVPEALARFAERAPSVLLSDIGMPREDGYSLIAKVRKLSAAEGGNVAAIALTAFARTEDRTRALLAGFSSHVPKPVEPMELLAVIASFASRIAKT